MGERMNAIPSSPARPVIADTHPIGRASAFGNLVRKECLDSREAAIAGVAIFWLVPVVLGLVELALAGRHDAFPFAWLVVIGAGWIYAIIIGAHTVCRDWGKAEEHFLLAQPVSPRTIVYAKLLTGAVLVAVVLGIAVGWDMVLVPSKTIFVMPERMLTILSMACVMAVGYAVAFAVAMMTRQMLASIVVATLALLVWAIAPLLSSRLTRFAAPALLPDVQRPSTIVAFVLFCSLTFLASVVVSIHYSTRERVFQLGHKQLAWTSGLVMLALFGIAMSEVGDSLHVRDQVTVTAPGLVRGLTWTIQRGDRFITAYYEYRPESRPVMAEWFLATFRVSDSGHIQDMRRTSLPGMLPPVNFGAQKAGHRGDQLTGLAFDKDGYIVMSGERQHIVSTRQDRELETVWRTTLAWPDGGELEVLSHAELALPPGERFHNAESWYESWHEGRDHAPRYAYLVSVVACTADNAGSYRDDKLYVFDWSDGLNPGPRYIIPLPRDDLHVSVRNGKVHVWTESGHFPDQHFSLADFNADRPETLLHKKNWSFKGTQVTHEYQWIQEFERLGKESIRVDQHGDVAYLSDQLGLRVARQTHPGRWEIIGEYCTSPLSMLFRWYTWPQALDDSLVIERDMRGIIAYDVSDPTHPRRIGFFNAIDLSPLDSSIFAAGQYLVLRENDLITVLDRPGERGNRNR
jgi:ABC-type transport system involved in multi-copper enzyme maturation permease subunit